MRRILFLFLPAALFAADLQTLIEKAERSDLVKSYEYEAESAAAAESAVLRAYLPKITAGYTKQTVDEKGTFEPGETTVGNLKANIVLFDGFRRENMMDEKAAAAEAAAYSASHFKKSQTLDVIGLYYSCLNLEEDIKAKEQKGKQLEAEVARLQQFYKAGSTSLDVVERMKASKAMNDYELHSLRLTLDRAKANLETITGETITTLERSTILEPAVYDYNDRDDIKAMEKSVQSLEYKAKQSHADYLPTLFVEDSYSTFEYGDFNPAFPVEMVEKQNKITMGVSLTLFDFFAKSKEKEALLLQKRKAQSRYSYQKAKAKRDLELARQSLATAKSSMEAANARKMAADKTFEYVDKKFKANVVDNVTYLDALSEKYEAQAMYTRSLNQYEYEKAAYYFYASKDIKEFVR